MVAARFFSFDRHGAISPESTLPRQSAPGVQPNGMAQ